MKLDAELYDLTRSLGAALFAATAPIRRGSGDPPKPLQPQLFNVQPGRAESPGWFLVQAAEFEPEPLTGAKLRVRDVYASPSMVRALLELMAAANWLDRRGEDYHLTEEGRALYRERQRIAKKWCARLDPLLTIDAAKLSALFGRVTSAALGSEDPPGHWCLYHSRNRAPGNSAPISLQLLQLVANLNAFRDDAHMAAWRPLGVRGFVWEAFTFVVAGQAVDAEGLFSALSYRGYAREHYGEALQDLAERGWLSPEMAASYAVTDQGRSIHKASEQLTDQYFYAPWRSALSESEIAAVPEQLARLNMALEKLA
jgi:DNA-binding MarR family transcriptional regulator